MPVRKAPNASASVEYESKANKFTRTVTPEMLAALKEQRGWTLDELGLELKRAVDKDAVKGYSRGQINNVLKGRDPVTKNIMEAFWIIAGQEDEIRAELQKHVPVRIYALPGQIPDGAILPPTAKAIRCANPACGIWFVRTHPFQKYHSAECKERRKHSA